HTEQDGVIDHPALCSHRRVGVHREQGEIERVAEPKSVQRAQIVLEATAKHGVAVVLDARVAEGVSHGPRLIETMLEEAASRPLRAVEEVVTRLTDEYVARDPSVRIRCDGALRREELTPARIIFLIVAQDRPGRLR